MPDRPNIFLLTDFGTTDHYVATMKAVMLARCPGANLIDISHAVAPQNVAEGAFLLESIWPWLPDGAVVLAVVDPGVGTARKPAVFRCEGKYLVGPNNGLFSFLPDNAKGRVLDNPKHWLSAVSSTFHGRDIFAPCAAVIAAGGEWTSLGNEPATPVVIDEHADDSSVRIIHFDHFGNAITTLKRPLPTRSQNFSVEIPGKTRCPFAQTYGDVNAGEVLACIGSTGRLEIAIRNGNARSRLGLELNDTVNLEMEPKKP